MVEKVKITYKGETRLVPATYMKGLKGYDRQKQIKSIFLGTERPKTKAPTQRSSWVEKYEKKYGRKISDKKWLYKNVISKTGAEKIIMKGKGAYYSSGSRPNQTAYSWGLARLASVIMNGPSRKIDKDLWEKYRIKKK
jgi:hypothetical protein|tara:strand:+ start:1045 stop:1458 length:414 start_codon:yes stop_codon:yes gene_type:complete